MGFEDYIGARDSVEAGVAEFVPPRQPCPECGKESKEANVFRNTGEVDVEGLPITEPVPGARICSDRNCRHEFNLMN